MDLETPIENAGRAFKMYSSRLEKLGITTFKDLLYHIPFRYDDYSIISKIANIQEGEIVTVIGEVLEIANQYTKSHKIQKAKIKDETGVLEVVWFNQPFLVKYIKTGDSVSLSGKILRNFNSFVMQSPDYEIFNENNIHTGRLVPIYPETRGVSSKWLRRQIFKILNGLVSIDDLLPDEIIKENSLLSLRSALWKIHFPDSLEEASHAKKRLGFEELFLIHAASLVRKKEWKQNTKGIRLKIESNKKKIDQFIKSLSFDLTNAQNKALKEIFQDIESGLTMNRLLEGEVGSGKTIVAAITIYATYLNNYQSLFIAPTEILAEQHYKTLLKLLLPLGLNIGIATASIKNYKNDDDVIIGTHALLNEKIKPKKLGLVVVDEQQRFGVEQRALIRNKGRNPHLLSMTATPIPRTVALTMYGDLSLSVLDEMPKDRKKVKTWLVPENKRISAYEWIKKNITETKSQVFIVCPFIEESESMTTIKAAKKEFESLKKIFDNFQLSLLHGKMKSIEKQEVLDNFRKETTQILVATPVVEVGIDFPNATIIIIEASERFGLAQLHQLRGRVGRGIKQSYCLLFTSATSDHSISRLKALETLHVGSELAEIDLKMRGPGEIYGLKQHGLPFLKAASFSDFELIKQTRKAAEKIINNIESYDEIYSRMKELNSIQISRD